MTINRPYGLSPIFLALNSEVAFTSEMLSSGIEQLRKTSYSRKGAYFQSFSSLSIGLERLAKMCVILDYALANNLAFPNEKYIRNIGHNLNELYTRCKSIQEDRDIRLGFPIDNENEIYNRILENLSRFAVGDRYANINFLINSSRIADPIAEWHMNVDMYIYDNLVSHKKKAMIENNAIKIHDILDNSAFTMHISQTNEPLNDMYSAVLEASKIELVIDIRQMFVVRLIRYLVEILDRLLVSYSSLSNIFMPNISDYFGIYMNEDKMIRSRKVFMKYK